MPSTLIRKFRDLTPQQRRVLFSAWRLLPVVVIRIRRRGVNDTREWLKEKPLRATVGGLLAQPGRALDEAQTIARLVNIAARYGLLCAQCLERSLVLQALLNARGIACELKFGVRQGQGPFEAHAWVEVQGQPMGDAGADHPSLSALA